MDERHGRKRGRVVLVEGSQEDSYCAVLDTLDESCPGPCLEVFPRVTRVIRIHCFRTICESSRRKFGTL